MKYLALTALLTLASASFGAGPVIVGHRGVPFYAPENTTPSIQMAWDLGTDGIECDIYLTIDKKLMVMHDKTTSRTGSGVNYNMKKTPSDILAKVDIGKFKHECFTGITIPFLKEHLQYHPKGKLFVIEVKDQPDTIAPLKKVLVETGRPWSDFSIISFNFDTCVEARKQMPEIEVYFLEGTPKDKKTKKYKNFTNDILKKAKAANLTGVDLNYIGVTKELVDECHKMGMKFNVWTVDDKDTVQRMTRYGVDFITTNRADTTRRYVDEVLNEKK